MRYGQRGGYTPAEQQRRERVRLQAAERFARGDGINEIAHDLRVMPGSVRRWRRAWQDGGTAALQSKGPVSREPHRYWIAGPQSAQVPVLPVISF